MTTTSLERRQALRDDQVAQYERMVEIREFEERVNDMFAAGTVHGTTHLCQGQEALAVGLASVLQPEDVVTATYRCHGVALALGMTVESVLAEIMGKSAGCTGGLGGSMHLSDMEVGLLPTFAIVGAGLPVAAGAALAFQTRGEANVGVAVFGDGATNIGAFHEALNMAAVWRLPVVFVCDNNVYGEYSRIDRTTPIEDLHLRSTAYGIPGISVDGMDLQAVTEVAATAVERARGGGGPTLIEAKTYRFAGHSRADQALYRPPGELETWRQRDPVPRMRAALLSSGVAGEAVLAALEERVRSELDAAVARVSAGPEPQVADMFKNVWTALPNREASS